VSVVLIAEDAGGSGADGGAEAYPARVQSVEPAATDGSVIVELAVSAVDAARISSAAATESVAVVQVPPRGDA
jgi:hypothetical protein